jgi:FKBP-type peptidyl-prolyl cis-trans isomerase (trigger factor)
LCVATACSNRQPKEQPKEQIKEQPKEQIKGKALMEKYSSCPHVKPEDNKIGFSIVDISEEENKLFVQWKSSVDLVMEVMDNTMYVA